jgi:hypothetical protein
MRIEKREVVYLSTKEMDMWSNFSTLLENIEKEVNSPSILDSIGEIIGHMSNLYCVIECDEID